MSNLVSVDQLAVLADEVPLIDPCEEFVRELSLARESLASYIHALLPNAADADDVLQRCCMLLWQKFGEYDRTRSFRAWACGVAFYEVRNFLRSSNRRQLQFNSELMAQIADQRLEEAEVRDSSLLHLRACLSLLKPDDQDLLKTAYASSRGLQSLADKEGVKLKSLYNQLWRLRKVLTECVQKKLALEGEHYA